VHSQIDVLDNVAFGDNARIAGTPIFAGDPSETSILDGDLSQTFRLRRLWLQFLIPIGQIRIGRQPSNGGLGLLFNDGNGFRNDFGDALDGTTYDRVLFATRPLTIINALTRGDSRPTPLIFALAYDWLAEDTLGVGRDPIPRRPGPFTWLTGGEDDVWQTTMVLAWNDADFNSEVNARDELSAGLVLVHRGQDSTSSNVWIGDFFYRLRWSAFGRRAPSLYSEGELYTIQGTTNGVGLIGPIDPDTGRTGMQGGANIWGGAARLGVESAENAWSVPNQSNGRTGATYATWAAYLESGFSTGQEGAVTAIGSYSTLTQRPNNNAYMVGLLLYPLVLAVRTANQYTETFDAVWSGGGVWNSVYILPNIRVRPIPGLELIGQFLVAFADQLNLPLADNRDPAPASTFCGLGEECLLGWEADVALKMNWGPNDEMRWSNEFGIMGAGPALGPRLQSSIVWTLQSRIAYVF
ncbi:MAG: hypothetical protein KC619_31405, partial [Myxococcales bacterium]|nr:hypothetical protein [Myxococcales bacterium]